MICPNHNQEMFPTVTQYGKRYQCPVPECDVICWDGKTSTPADGATRTARNAAHAVFDNIWQQGHISRKEAYMRLSEYLGKPIDETHIGMFDIETCEKVEQFAFELNKNLLLAKFS